MEDGHGAALEKEQKQVNRIYAALSAMIIFSCLPVIVLQVVGILLMFYVLIGAYALRARCPEDSFANNHMTWLIRSFWISSLFFGIGFAAAVVYLSQNLDLGSVTALEDAVMSGQFVMTDGIKKLALVSLATMGPSLVYFVYRSAKGLSRALKGHRMGNVKEWF